MPPARFGKANQDQAVEDQLLEGATGVFGDEVKAEPADRASM